MIRYCPVCDKEIDDRGYIWHLKKIHEMRIEDIMELLFDKLNQYFSLFWKSY